MYYNGLNVISSIILKVCLRYMMLQLYGESRTIVLKTGEAPTEPSKLLPGKREVHNEHGLWPSVGYSGLQLLQLVATWLSRY